MAESNVADDDEEMWYEDAPTAVEKVEKYEEKQKNGECTEERVIQETKKKFLLLAKSTSRSTAYSRVNTAEETMSVYVTVCEFLGAHFRDEHLCENLRVGRLREATGLVEVTFPPGFYGFPGRLFDGHQRGVPCHPSQHAAGLQELDCGAQQLQLHSTSCGALAHCTDCYRGGRL